MKTTKFMILPSFYDALECLSEEDQKEMALAILKYGSKQKQPTTKIKTTSHLNAIWILLKPIIDKSISFNNKQIENGKKGGAPIKNTNAKKQPKNNPKTTHGQPKNNREMEGEGEGEMEGEGEIEKETSKEKRVQQTGIEKSLVDDFPSEQMETYAQSKRLPLKVIEDYKEGYLLWIQSNPKKKECKNRDMKATIQQWVVRDIKCGKLVPKKTREEIIKDRMNEIEAEYGKVLC